MKIRDEMGDELECTANTRRPRLLRLVTSLTGSNGSLTSESKV